ncbi:MAG: hypothetical protein DCF12_10660 [Snowella sp.]|nr:MAG: hypothetical protein DCF12_10660 [Snowella sp.]
MIFSAIAKRHCVIALPTIILVAQVPIQESSFEMLKKQLEQADFQVILDLPPQRGAYGLLKSDGKKIWINPVVFELGIAEQTLIHEAVHAAQVCKGKGKFALLGLDIDPLIYAQPFFMHYGDTDRKELEREAYAVQTQPNRVELISSLLKKYCH